MQNLPSLQKMFEGNKDTKETINKDKPEKIMDVELCGLVDVLTELLEENNNYMIKNQEKSRGKEIVASFYICENISAMFASKLGKSCHLQILSF